MGAALNPVSAAAPVLPLRAVETVADLLRQQPSDAKGGRRIITIRMSETVKDAITMMAKERVGALVVTDACATEGHVVVGMFSERDVVRLLDTHGPAAMSMKLGAVMTIAVISCTLGDTLDHVCGVMDEKRIRHVPVMQDGALVGVLSVRDVIAGVRRRSA